MLPGTTLSHYLCTTDSLLISHLVSACADEARPGLTCLFSSRRVATVMFMVPQVQQPGLKDALCENQQETRARAVPGSPADGRDLVECMSLRPNFLSL